MLSCKSPLAFPEKIFFTCFLRNITFNLNQSTASTFTSLNPTSLQFNASVLMISLANGSNPAYNPVINLLNNRFKSINNGFLQKTSAGTREIKCTLLDSNIKKDTYVSVQKCNLVFF